MRFVAVPLTERFEQKYIPVTETGCWLWIASYSTKGYGRIGFLGRSEKAHRISWMIAYGPVPEDKHVLHKCDTRCCVNPDHLFLGTNLDNIKDRDSKGRTARGERCRLSKRYKPTIRTY